MATGTVRRKTEIFRKRQGQAKDRQRYSEDDRDRQKIDRDIQKTKGTGNRIDRQR